MQQKDLETLAERFAGSLLGQSLGDALGFAVEGRSTSQCAAYVDELRSGGAPRGRDPFAFGQYTDDSQLARELLQSWVARGAFEPEDYGRRVSALFSEGRVVGRGRATELAAARLARGVSWDEAGTPSPSAGNGSAMRAGPVGLLCAGEPDRLVRMAVDQGRITHTDSRCAAGSVLIAGATAFALGTKPGDPLDAPAFCADLQALARPVDAEFAALLALLPEWARLPPSDALRVIGPAGLPSGQASDWPGISPFVVPSVLWALYSFLRTPDDCLGSIYTAIAVGGDVDTTAAMAGAIAGARLGLGALPSPWVEQLEDRGTWRFSDLVALARDAAAACYEGLTTK